MARIKDEKGFQPLYLYMNFDPKTPISAEIQDFKTGEYKHIHLTLDQFKKFINDCQNVLESAEKNDLVIQL